MKCQMQPHHPVCPLVFGHQVEPSADVIMHTQPAARAVDVDEVEVKRSVGTGVVVLHGVHHALVI